MLKRISTLLALPVLTACSTPMPVYAPDPSRPSTTIKAVGQSYPMVCIGTQMYDTKPELRDGIMTLTVTAGERITIRSLVQYTSGGVRSTCVPRISVVPRAGVTLLLNSGMDGNQCFIEVVRENNAASTGVSVEPSLGPPQC
jgi:hypothetical protein